MNELKKIRLTEPRIFKKKGHEQLYKPNEQVKSAVNEAKDAVVAVKMAWRLKSHFSAWEEIGSPSSVHCQTAKQSAFLSIQVRARSQTKGLERG